MPAATGEPDMKHPIFVAAVDALERVETELGRLEITVSEYMATIVGAEQRVERLRKNEADLNVLISGLAKQGAAAREALAKSHDDAKKILAEAKEGAGNIVIEAGRQKDKIVAEAKHQADGIVQAAKANPVHAAVAKAKDELDSLSAKIQSAIDKHNKLKDAARAIAGD